MPDRDDPSAAPPESPGPEPRPPARRARGSRRAPPPEPAADAWARAEEEARAEAAAEAARSGPASPAMVGAASVARASPRCPYLTPAPTGSFDGFGSPGGLPGRGAPALAGGPDRCAAVGDPVELSDRQRTLVCLTAGHAECPRYLRATNEVPAFAPEAVEVARARPVATIAGVGAVVVAAAITVAFVAAGGGLSIAGPTEGPGPTGSDVAVASPSVSPGDSSEPGASATPSDGPSIAPSTAPSVGPSTPPSPRPSSPGTTPAPSSDRYELLVPCPDQPDCYVYTIRSGDNLFSIARYFGVPLETVYELNPWARRQGIQAGDELILPPPTR